MLKNIQTHKHHLCLQTDRSGCQACQDNFINMFVWCIVPTFFQCSLFKDAKINLPSVLQNTRGTVSPHAAEVRPPKKMPSTTDSFYDMQKNKKSEIMITGRIISLQVNKNRTKCFTSALAFWVLAWECAGSASMLHSSLLEKEDGDLNTGLYCQHQMSPMLSKQYMGVSRI